MKINSQIPFLSDYHIECRVNALLNRYQSKIEPILAPPVPVEKIADFLLELNLDWSVIPDTEDAPILASIHPETKTIRLNEQRKAHFDKYNGTYEFTLAHEIGHYELHLHENNLEQLQFDFGHNRIYLCRSKNTGDDKREWQAELFASYLLMPSFLLMPAIEQVNILYWPILYGLRETFRVSITALRLRLEHLKRLYVSPDGRLYHNREEAVGQLTLL